MATKTYLYKRADGDKTKRAKLTDVTTAIGSGGSSTTPETPNELTFCINTSELQVYRYNSSATSGVNISSEILGNNKTFSNDVDILYLGTINGDAALNDSFGLNTSKYTISNSEDGDSITSSSSIIGVYYLIYKLK